MTAAELIALLQKLPGDAEVLIEADLGLNEDDDIRTTFKIADTLAAYATGTDLDHQTWDISHHMNGREGDRHIMILSNEAITRMTLASDDGWRHYRPATV
ncbi:MAG: hypothetical protein EOO83_00215 [Oxalobacteraceae bacterium]|nr:MAG: hypothetical protein EOO83_00215 [Oxalobacteraceae bacterium]